MTPDEIKQIIETIEQTDDSNALYVVISVLVVLAPVLVWAIRIILKNSIEDIVDKGVTPQIELLEKTFKRDREANEQMFNIMEMHIDELRHVKFQQTEMSKRIEANETNIETLKNAG